MNFIKLSSNLSKLSYKSFRTFAKGNQVRSGLKKGDNSDAGYGGSRGKVAESENQSSGRPSTSENQSEGRSKTKSEKDKMK